jgi:hypothetical protein
VRGILVPVERREFAPQRGRARHAAAPVIEVSVEAEGTESYLLVVRHASGALSFHAPETPEVATPAAVRGAAAARRKRSARAAGRQRMATFKVPLSIPRAPDVRRGVVSDAVEAIVDAILVRIGAVVAETVVDLAEAAIWKLTGRERGLFRVTKEGLAAGRLEPVKGPLKAGPSGRALLFLHGTFSTTEAAFADLASGNFFERVKSLYGDAIYGFNHHSVSVSPEANVEELLSLLKSGSTTFDVVTHSRGGLVLRTLVERANAFQHASRFKLGHAVLVAAPNEGTPVVTPERWNETVGWFANLFDLFPPNPVTSGAAMVAHWIAWLARIGVDAAEGLEAMDMRGEAIKALQQPPAPPPDRIAALVSNFQAGKNVLARAFDLGLTAFFETANDLVVPTAGGWRIDATETVVPAERVGCFGRGGNIGLGDGPPTHISFFSRPETVDFLVKALHREPQGLGKIDLGAALPTIRRGVAGVAEIGTEAAVPGLQPAIRPKGVPKAITAQTYSSVLELTVVKPSFARLADGRGRRDESIPFMLASYGGARVLVPFAIRNSDVVKEADLADDVRYKIGLLRKRWGELFGYHRRIREYFQELGNVMPPSRDIRRFGELLFETLLPGDVRRLYDAARSREKDKLYVIFTSMIGWLSDMPWELARDPARRTYFATEDVHFIRNVFTPTPADGLGHRIKLKMLIAVAEPTTGGYPLLQSEREAAHIKSGLSEIERQNLLEIAVRTGMTPALLQQEVSTGGYDIVHFIGHGYRDTERGSSGLVLEDGKSGALRLGDRPLREILSGRGIRVLFLNACDTGRGMKRSKGSDEYEDLSVLGTAQSFFSRGVPNVIANQLPVADSAAVDFATAFYSYIAHGKTIAQATREARIATLYGSGSHKGAQNIDWAIPVVFARDPNDTLVQERRSP